MKKTFTVTIGIPAFNEEGNIGYLLSSILEQKTSGFVLSKIIVNSDGCTDKTVEIVQDFKDKRIVLIENKHRAGQAPRQNQIMEKCTSDVLILLNADIAISGKHFLVEMVNVLTRNKADLVSSAMWGLPPGNFMENIVTVSMQIRNYIYEKYRGGKNIGSCHGTARAMSKKFYQKFRFRGSVGEDAFSYLFCVYNKFKYEYASKAVCYIKLPDTFADHGYQSMRNIKTIDKFEKEFGSNFIKNEYGGSSFFYGMPFALEMEALTVVGIRNPVYTLLFLAVAIYFQLKATRTKGSPEKWTQVASSKVLVGIKPI